MPRLAKHLGVGTMSLYRHVDDKNDLINAVAERVLGDVQVPDGKDDDWEGRVVGYLRALRDAALAHPALARILAERGLTVGPVFEQLEQAHSILRRAGFSDEGAVRTFYTLFTYVFGFVIWELPRVHEQPATAYVDSWNAAIDLLDINSYPPCTRCAMSSRPPRRPSNSNTGSTGSSDHYARPRDLGTTSATTPGSTPAVAPGHTSAGTEGLEQVPIDELDGRRLEQLKARYQLRSCACPFATWWLRFVAGCVGVLSRHAVPGSRPPNGGDDMTYAGDERILDADSHLMELAGFLDAAIARTSATAAAQAMEALSRCSTARGGQASAAGRPGAARRPRSASS